MDLTAVVRSYVERMLREVSGMKVLLLDAETTKIVSTVYSQSEILEQEVYLVERLDADRGDQLLHMKAVCFLRPTRENCARIRRELRDPRYGQYFLYFSNRLEDLRISELAEEDRKELVSGVQEYFGDYVVLDPHHFTVPVARPAALLQPSGWDFASWSDAVARTTEGLAALALSLRRRFQIRYQRGSEVCQKLAESLAHLTGAEERELFDFGRRKDEAAPLMLILDRRDDPVTPLLLQWTFQAMVAELLGMELNRVDLTNRPGIKPDFQDIVLSARQDEFFCKNMYANFGDLGDALKALVDEFQQATSSSRNIQTIEDMQNFVEGFSEFSAAQRNAGKHVTLMSELSAAVDSRGLMQTSSVEQDLVCSSGSDTSLKSDYRMVADLINNARLTDDDRVRLVMLFALRYERDGRSEISSLIQRCQDFGMSLSQLGIVRTILLQAGADKRVGDLFSDRTVSSFLASMARKARENLKGVENVYTQHTPLLTTTLKNVARGQLAHMDYPYVGGAETSPTAAKVPRLVVAFIVGGTTYEEARAVAEANAATERGQASHWAAGMRIILGGTGVQTSATFMAQIREMMMNERHSR